MSRIDKLNLISTAEDWLAFCGCREFATQMVANQPFDPKNPSDRCGDDCDSVHRCADEVFDRLQRDDWLEAFAAHPPIGDTDSLRMKFAGNRQWSAGEQSGIDGADDAVIQSLADGNRRYRERFGYLFIVCASGLSAAEMLSRLESRIDNDPADEFLIAAAEQRKITHLRIDKFASNDSDRPLMKSPITTHVLDTAAGKPAAGIRVTLHRGQTQTGHGVTDDDGRIMSGLIDDDDYVAGDYKIVFETGDYLRQRAAVAFYRQITIDFVVEADQDHYHIPVLLSPYGYTTYRGS